MYEFLSRRPTTGRTGPSDASRAWAVGDAAWIAVGGFLAISSVGVLGWLTGVPLLIAPFGSTCMMIFGASQAPFARPRNVLGGHLICSVVGLLTLHLFGASPWTAAVAVGVSMALMGLTRTFHPPAGGDPVLVMLTQPAWTFVFVPVLLGCVLMLGVAVVFHNLRSWGSYPVRVRVPAPATPVEET
jgi:CBS-domain-containing membrane protein